MGETERTAEAMAGAGNAAQRNVAVSAGSRMQVVIQAGGRGTRMASVDSSVPKPLIPLLGKPILEHQLERIAGQGYTDIVMIVGYLHEKIQEYFGDGSGISPATGRPFGVRIRYVVEEEPLGTAGSLGLLRGLVEGDFFLFNGDIIFDVDLDRFARFHAQHGAEATLLTHKSSHIYDSAVIVCDGQGRVTRWLNKEDERTWYPNRGNSGLHILSAGVLDLVDGLAGGEPCKLDLDRQVLPRLIERGTLYAYDTTEYVKDVGTPDRFRAAEADLRDGKPARRCLQSPQKAVFLDRDGTVNCANGFVTELDELELIPGAAQALAAINGSDYLAVLVTNQPALARGELTREGLERIHDKLETLLGAEGAFLDDILFCPHHPDRGFAGEVPELKVACSCRKPEPGLLIEAAARHNIDLSASWMVGDSWRDIEAGARAGCKVAYIGEAAYPGVPDGVRASIPADQVPAFATLGDFVDALFDGGGEDACAVPAARKDEDR